VTTAEPRTAATAAQCAHAVLHCNLNTADIERSAAFYVGALGIEDRIRSLSSDGDATAMGLGRHTASVTALLWDRRGPRAAPALELVGWTHPPVEPRGAASSGLAAIGFRTADLDRLVPEIQAAGGHVEPVVGGLFVRGGLRPGLITVDPDGVRVEVVEIAPAADDAGAAALSHERVRCADIDASLSWYAIVGWQLGGRSGDGTRASLVLPEDPTFSIELEHDPTITTRPSTAVTQGLYRIALAVEDVHAAHKALEASGCGPVAEPAFFSMPDTPTGGFTVLFLADPDGVVVELVVRPRSAVRRPTEPR
jgi:catechol 2,3-dioxygenase-like lactoylglutathione lyase family enzyme